MTLEDAWNTVSVQQTSGPGKAPLMLKNANARMNGFLPPPVGDLSTQQALLVAGPSQGTCGLKEVAALEVSDTVHRRPCHVEHLLGAGL